MGLKFVGKAKLVSVDVETNPGVMIMYAEWTESPKPLGKRARRRLRGRLKQEKRNGKA